MYEGNCLELFRQLKEDSVNHVLTSPPYNRKRNDKYNFYEDTLTDYKTLLTEVINHSMRVSSGYVFFNVQKNYYNKKEIFKLLGDFADNIVEIIIWNKQNPMPASGVNITNSYEFVVVFQKEGKPLKANSTYTKNHFTTNVYSDNQYKEIHRALMHPQACDFIIENFIKEGDTVLDPFFGLGTTALSCIKYKVNYIGFELSTQYVEVAKERIQNYLAGQLPQS